MLHCTQTTRRVSCQLSCIVLHHRDDIYCTESPVHIYIQVQCAALTKVTQGLGHQRMVPCCFLGVEAAHHTRCSATHKYLVGMQSSIFSIDSTLHHSCTSPYTAIPQNMETPDLYIHVYYLYNSSKFLHLQRLSNAYCAR